MAAILKKLHGSDKNYKMFAMTLATKQPHTDFINFKADLIKEMNLDERIKRRVKIHYGKDDTGDIYQRKNIDSFVELVGANKAHLITADGGFDEASLINDEYDKETVRLYKEVFHYKLILAEVVAALHLQAPNGSFVLKVFDCNTMLTARLIYMLSLLYDQLHIIKPLSSRPANSERYIVARY